MDKKRMLAVAILMAFIIGLTFTAYYFLQQKEGLKPFWLKSGAYVTYAQAFAWNEYSETQYMTWELTRVDDDNADLHLLSHGISVVGENVTVVSGEADWKIDTTTLEIVDSSDANYVGQKCPFWIGTNLKVGSTVDTLYGISTITKSEKTEALGIQRDCWVLEYSWPSSNMKRWYDKSTGICLKIHVTMYKQGITITTIETAVLTSIDAVS